jgi:hypothetical protein
VSSAVLSAERTSSSSRPGAALNAYTMVSGMALAVMRLYTLVEAGEP